MRQPPLPPSMNQSNGIHDFIHSIGNFDPTNEEFLDQMLSSVPSNPWVVDIDPTSMVGDVGGFDDKTRHHQQQQQVNCNNNGLMLQHQLLGINNGSSPSILNSDLNDHDSTSFNSANLGTDASVKALFDGFAGTVGQTHSQSQQFHHNQQQGQSFGAAQPKQQRVRARRGQATDPHSIAERLRRERIAERMKSLQELVPNANKTDKASMLDEIIDYVKFLRLQVKVLSMSRLGGAAAVAPLVADKSSELLQTASSSSNEGVMVTEQQVAKLMEEDMGSAMQYLQGKGLCLMPISLATAISTTTTAARINNKGNNGGGVEEAGGPTSPGISAISVQSGALGGSGNGASAKAN